MRYIRNADVSGPFSRRLSYVLPLAPWDGFVSPAYWRYPRRPEVTHQAHKQHLIVFMSSRCHLDVQFPSR